MARFFIGYKNGKEIWSSGSEAVAQKALSSHMGGNPGGGMTSVDIKGRVTQSSFNASDVTMAPIAKPKQAPIAVGSSLNTPIVDKTPKPAPAQATEALDPIAPTPLRAKRSRKQSFNTWANEDSRTIGSSSLMGS